jgi:hypothetical protein
MTMSERMEVGRARDLTGQRFGRLEVLYRVKPVGRVSMTGAWWHCKCDCGVEFDTMANSLMRGGTVSCGCKQRENLAKGWSRIAERMKKHERP